MCPLKQVLLRSLFFSAGKQARKEPCDGASARRRRSLILLAIN
ncbi:hypothetical protein [Nostoc sp. LEGE 12447]|nr:hypothetical protein [Nostoc sp. LEGE 12447]